MLSNGFTINDLFSTPIGSFTSTSVKFNFKKSSISYSSFSTGSIL